ncbi:hypothetical protein EAF00_009889 [Botryotinia globosa]|nr:hypothetical protein EAF00_009889 [Botryotinia globosa]
MSHTKLSTGTSSNQAMQVWLLLHLNVNALVHKVNGRDLSRTVCNDVILGGEGVTSTTYIALTRVALLYGINTHHTYSSSPGGDRSSFHSGLESGKNRDSEHRDDQLEEMINHKMKLTAKNSECSMYNLEWISFAVYAA